VNGRASAKALEAETALLVLRGRTRVRLGRLTLALIRPRHLAAGFCLLLLAWVASPYYTVWRLSQAIAAGNAAPLERLVDWPSVRAGLKHDVADGLLGVAAPQVAAANTLPPFGASFVAGIAGSAIDDEITPTNVVAALHAPMAGQDAADGPRIGWHAIRWAFFRGLRVFDVSLLYPGGEPGEQKLRIRLSFQGTSWKVTRVWVPQDLMDRLDEAEAPHT
jgi:hypothetical protein